MSVSLRDFLRVSEFEFLFAQLLNVETSTLGISGARFTPKCEVCKDNDDVTFECSACGITATTFAQVRSGQGDGVYPLFESQDQLAVAVLFDLHSTFANAHSDWCRGGVGPNVALEAHSGDLLGSTVFEVARIKVANNSLAFVDTGNLVAMGDACAGNDDVVSAGVAGEGDVEVFVVLGPRDEAHLNDLVPRLVIAGGVTHIEREFRLAGLQFDVLPASAGADWFKYPVAANISGGNAERALFQTAKHCQGLAEMFQDGDDLTTMRHWVAKGLANRERLIEIGSAASSELNAILDDDFTEGTYEDWWAGEINSISVRTGVAESIFLAHRHNEKWLMTCGTQQELKALREKGGPETKPETLTPAADSPRPKFCSGCGSPVPDVGAFCSNCGNKFN